jgi:hypothetical protein
LAFILRKPIHLKRTGKRSMKSDYVLVLYSGRRSRKIK